MPEDEDPLTLQEEEDEGPGFHAPEADPPPTGGADDAGGLGSVTGGRDGGGDLALGADLGVDLEALPPPPGMRREKVSAKQAAFEAEEVEAEDFVRTPFGAMAASFAYPLGRGGVTFFLTACFASIFAGGFFSVYGPFASILFSTARGTRSFGTLSLLVMALFVAAVFGGWMFTLRSAADGPGRRLEFPGDPYEDLLSPGLCYLAVVFFAWAPPVAIMMLSGVSGALAEGGRLSTGAVFASLLAGAAGLLYFPMALTRAAAWNSLACANPLDVARAILAVPGDYLLCVAFFYGLSLLSALATTLVGLLAGLCLGEFLGGILAAPITGGVGYYTMAVANANLGFLAFRRREELGL